ncbi:MAG: M15 family metallopeptidase [Oscillospiraceae bacterium]|nr:M15 family metallopeptidase [Oscillospiraceae bacterium]
MPDYKSQVTMNSSGFVLLSDYVPGIVQEIRYYSTYNFVGDRIDGYEEPCALLTVEAARALRTVSNELNVQGFRLKVFDAYRPASAVRHFVLWGIEDLDLRMKPFFYPDLEKQELFSKGYIASQSSHSRGSTVDLTLLDMKTGKELDMGTPFDLFSEASHPDYRDITDEQYQNRMLLRNTMLRNGFLPIDCEWWHFSLKYEPYPDTYFEFPVSSSYLKRNVSTL